MSQLSSSPELSVIVEFLHTCLPFNELPNETLHTTARHINIIYRRKGQYFDARQDDPSLRIVRSGAVEIRSSQNQLLDRLGESENFNIHGLDMGDSGIKAYVIEDAIIYQLPRIHYENLRSRYRNFDRHFHSQRSRRLRRAARYQPSTNAMMRPITSLISQNPLSFPERTSLQEAAKAMSDRRVSSVLVMNQSNQLRGIVTDRDLRTRAIAKGLPVSTPLSNIMTPEPISVHPDDTLFDALFIMTQNAIHHLPVVQHQRVMGIITSSDLMLARRDDPIYLVQHLSKQSDIKKIRSVVQNLSQLLVEMLKSGMRSYQASQVLTAISDAITTRLIELSIEEIGPAPVPFCWLSFGSQARCEQLIGADQDNGLIIDDSAQPSDLIWFQNLAKRVCDGLNECGYPYCNGNIMATNDQWRLPLDKWKNTVDTWMQSPTPNAVLRVSIFFDIRSVYGNIQLCQQLQTHMLQQTQRNTIFLAALAANVLEQTPPLGIFRRFLVERSGEHRDAFDLKKRGVMPIIDLVRIHSLAKGLTALNTRSRIQALMDNKIMTIEDARNLQDSFDYIQQLRAETQCRQILESNQVNNYCSPKDLSELTRKHLKDTFTIVHDFQEGLRNRFRQGL